MNAVGIDVSKGKSCLLYTSCISFSVPVVLPKGVHPVEEQKKGQREQM